MIGLTVEEIEIFQFIDSAFAVNVRLSDLGTNQPKTGELLNLKVLLAFEGNASIEHRCKEHHPNLLEIISNSGITANGTAQIWIKVKDMSMNYDNQRFVVYLEAYCPVGEKNILSAVTNPFTCIRHKLIISEANNAPYTWYKDEGAKDKAIRVLVKLVDASRTLVKDREVPLSISLIYSSGQPVQPSSVLTVFHDKDRPLLLGPSGSEVVRFRVNEVSRNHRKQMFHLLVTPDIQANSAVGDISPATSVAFEVKSKRTADVRKEHSHPRYEDDSSQEALAPDSDVYTHPKRFRSNQRNGSSSAAISVEPFRREVCASVGVEVQPHYHINHTVPRDPIARAFNTDAHALDLHSRTSVEDRESASPLRALQEIATWSKDVTELLEDNDSCEVVQGLLARHQESIQPNLQFLQDLLGLNQNFQVQLLALLKRYAPISGQSGNTTDQDKAT